MEQEGEAKQGFVCVCVWEPGEVIMGMDGEKQTRIPLVEATEGSNLQLTAP